MKKIMKWFSIVLLILVVVGVAIGFKVYGDLKDTADEIKE